jgi:hypothetical protein
VSSFVLVSGGDNNVLDFCHVDRLIVETLFRGFRLDIWRRRLGRLKVIAHAVGMDCAANWPDCMMVMTSGGREVTETGRPISPTSRHGLSKEN